VLNILVPQVGLQNPCVVSWLASAWPQACRSMWGGALNPSFASEPARLIIQAKPATVKGVPRSDVNTNGDLGSYSR